MPNDPAIDIVAKLHRAVDIMAQPLSELHKEALQCRRGCAACCVDDITVFAVEAEQIRRHYRDMLQTEAPAPKGQCAFLAADKSCRIYAHRPYVCRTQGLPLRWFEDDVELRDICTLNEQVPLESLAPPSCWTIGPVEAKLVEIQRMHQNETDATPTTLKRVALRALFSESP